MTGVLPVEELPSTGTTPCHENATNSFTGRRRIDPNHARKEAKGEKRREGVSSTEAPSITSHPLQRENTAELSRSRADMLQEPSAFRSRSPQMSMGMSPTSPGPRPRMEDSIPTTGFPRTRGNRDKRESWQLRAARTEREVGDPSCVAFDSTPARGRTCAVGRRSDRFCNWQRLIIRDGTGVRRCLPRRASSA